MKMIENIKYYEQEDVDSIVEKAKLTQASKYEKTHIEMQKYSELESKYNELNFGAKKETFKDTFKTKGGNLDTYEDFITLHKDLLELDPKVAAEQVDKIKEQKKHFFNNQPAQTVDRLTALPRDSIIVDELMGKPTEKLVEGTIYKSNL